MESELLIDILNWAVIGLSLGTLVVLLATGALRERSLRLGPTRDLGLSPHVYLAGTSAVMCYVVLKLALGGVQREGLQLGLELIPFALVGLLIGRASHAESGFRRIGLVPRRPGRDAVWGGVAVVVGLLLAGASGLAVKAISKALNQPVDPIGHETLKLLNEDFSPGLLIQVIVSAVVLAPLFEELIFRGIMQTSLVHLMKGRRWPALGITAAAFSVTHVWVVPWQGLVPLFVLGLVFGYVYERTGSLLTPIIAHAGFNAVNIALALTLPPELAG